VSRLNLGCGDRHLPGFVNVDARPPADVVGDLMTLTFVDADEVRMIHALEHFPWQVTQRLLARIRSWMRPGAPITIEVPDMVEICRDPEDPWFVIYTYGIQAHVGEIHFNGFTERTLREALTKADFTVTASRTFRSPEPQRIGMPCLEVQAVA
jgi:hypothetical protein